MNTFTAVIVTNAYGADDYCSLKTALIFHVHMFQLCLIMLIIHFIEMLGMISLNL